MKISELNVGDTSTLTLVVKSATALETKAKKPYLALEFFDGSNTISGNYWDWTSGNIPAVNAILNVTAQVTEWQGTKQLNVKSMTLDTSARIEDFAPSSGYDLSAIYNKALALLESVSDETLKTIAIAVLKEAREQWLTVPAASRVHHNYVGGTLIHSYNVAVKAKAMAEVTFGANIDLAIVGGFLHDVGKLFTYRFNGVNIENTFNGKLYDHIFIGAEFIGNFAEAHVDCDDPYVYGKLRLLRHIILSHHGKLDYGSPVTPQCVEAYIVHYADALDADVEQIVKATKDIPADTIWTDKIWTLHNRPHLSCRYVAELMKN
jgi:3'-5' exoribonuclease